MQWWCAAQGVPWTWRWQAYPGVWLFVLALVGLFRALRARFVPDAQPDPYTVLGVTPDMSQDEIRKVWRRMVRETHLPSQA